jgi:hypothetical protein
MFASQLLDGVLAGAGIPIAIGIALLGAHHYYPDRFPSSLTAKAIRLRAFLPIAGGLALTIWDTLRRLR